MKELDLHSNQIQTIPSEIGNLINLKELLLWHNQIQTIFNSSGLERNYSRIDIDIDEKYSEMSDSAPETLKYLLGEAQSQISNNHTLKQKLDIFLSENGALKSNLFTGKVKTINFLVGTWKNEWTINGHTDSEILTITNDYRYLIVDAHIFNITHFIHEPDKNEVKFIKEGAQPGDLRKHLNTLFMQSDDLLTGSEDNYQIRYTRIKI